MAAEPVENARAGTAGVDECRRPAPSRYLGRIDTERCPAPIDVRVEIDQPGHDEQPAHINGLGTAGREIAPDFSYFSVAEGDIGHLVASVCWVDNTAACEDQIPHVRASLKPAVGTKHDTGVGGGRRGQCG